ncbi:MAG: recombination factor protein RarA [Piscirickettsiaceae bacterium CG_4_9_14_3_um_filter_43_564]|nr:replication-associated recombination protein A [Thiomicrospira sp.]OIP95002.1 MAG: recombination factor protein RarA [Thiomicrospira sp. CG2_30_44_34]PIQ04934.1 MAG: recombination factor protein RarA [Piscirickettsiaceae bacterium CG18_big_fil_WC_8_21_14_2_50_44_103]PIU38210.1 MAG: recombination factor protein RarA [Piscirickettsiaceae bacterium CG07_land_8_20_14_0_80_44_28]PIW57339.1 MAG: recombination factor protein RarA [Piscirickettsiaceae bacterium CG12_big_fil_rev_8_21_14_0_65_44_934]
MTEINQYQPLSDRLRPQTLDQFVGQTHLLGEGRALSKLFASKRLHSMIFWGPPGTGKTTLARLIANQSNLQFLSLSAVLDGVKEVRAAVEQAKLQRQQFQQGSVLFVDEVHRFNKAQQDAFLPYVEDGTFIFIGATTENPSFELNNALLSRARVYVLRDLEEEDLAQVLARGVGLLNESQPHEITVEPQAQQALIQYADGDARRLLNVLEQAVDFIEWPEKQPGLAVLTAQNCKEVIQGGTRRFDKGGEAFYDQISALHKSVRGSDANAALYWLTRMLDGGVDARYLARRLIRMASEEIGNADLKALEVTIHAAEAYDRLGSPEGDLALAQAAVYLAVAPKSNAVYRAYKAALKEVKTQGTEDVPLHLRNAPTKLMQGLGYAEGYRYAHDEPDAYAAGECYFPDDMPVREYYQPVNRGLEIKIAEKIHRLKTLDKQAIYKRRTDPTSR